MHYKGWIETNFGEILTLEYGASLPETSRTGEGFSVYGSNGMVGKHKDYLVENPGIIIGRKGTVGAVVWSPDSFWPIDTTYYVKLKTNINLRFIYWYLNYLPLRSLDSSTGVPGLNRNDVYRLVVKIPDQPEEQRRIAEILDTVDETIALTTSVIAKLKQIRAGLLHDLLTRGLDEDGKLRDAIGHPEQFKDSPLGRIPKNWKVQPLSELADVDRGKFTHRPRNDPHFYGGLYPFVQTGDIAKAVGEILTTYSQTLNERGITVSCQFPVDSIAITIAANIADTAILGIPMFFPDSIVGAIVKPPNNVRYIELCIRSAKQQLDANAPQSAQKNINLADLRPLLIAVANPKEQTKIAEVYEFQNNRILTEEAYLDKLKLQKKGLMHDLLTGKVRVNQI